MKFRQIKPFFRCKIIRKNLKRFRFSLPLEGDGELSMSSDIQDESMKSMGDPDLNSKTPTSSGNADPTFSATRDEENNDGLVSCQ